VFAGKHFVMAMTNQDVLWSWGKGRYGVLGHGSEEDEEEPRVVRRFESMNVVDLGVGSYHCVAIGEDENVYCWGRNECGQLGRGTISSHECDIDVVQFNPNESPFQVFN